MIRMLRAAAGCVEIRARQGFAAAPPRSAAGFVHKSCG
jgi:hypothetical protein